jgi:ABC-2 type transport system ATP-binding protein
MTWNGLPIELPSWKVDTSIDDFTNRVSIFAVRGNKFNPSVVAAIPGLIEARKLGDRLQLAIADADEETLAAIDRLSDQVSERIEASLGDAVLAYLTRERGDGSFFSSPVTTASPPQTMPTERKDECRF